VAAQDIELAEIRRMAVLPEEHRQFSAPSGAPPEQPLVPRRCGSINSDLGLSRPKTQRSNPSEIGASRIGADCRI